MRYLVSFRGRLFYRRAVPKDVQGLIGLRSWKRALGTATFTREAEQELRRLAVQHDEDIANARLASDPDQSNETRALALYALRRLESRARPKTSRKLLSGIDPILREVRKKIEVQRVEDAEERLKSLSEADRKIVEQAGGPAALWELCTTPSDQAILPSIDEADARAKRRRQRHYFDLLRKLGFPVHIGKEPNNPAISDAIAPWFLARKQQASAQQRHRVAIKRFIELNGDLRTQDITREHIKAYLSAIEKCADHRRLPSKNRGGLADPGADVPRVSASTVDRHLASIKALLAFCVEQGWCSANAASGLRPPKDTRPKASKRRPWTLEERRLVLARAISEDEEDGDMPWLIRLAVYTGARLEELAQLACTNVREVDGIPSIEIDDLQGRKLKTDRSARLVPLHPAIAAIFMAWVAKRKGDRVFATFRNDADGRYANYVSGRFAALRKRAGLDERLKFHTLRDTFIDGMRNARLDPDVRRAVVGHADRTAHGRYGYGSSLLTMAEEIAKLPPQI